MDAFPISSDLLGKSASAYEHLRRAVSRGQLRPGRRLSASGLAAAFKISETPVREALLRLGAEGFLAWEPSKGHFTKPATMREQADLHELIAFNLTGCLSHGAGEEMSELDAFARLVERSIDEPVEGRETIDQTVQLIEGLVAILVARSGNQVMSSVMSILSDRVWLIRRLDLEAPGRIGQARQRMAGVISAVRSRDAATAIAIVSVHLAERRRRLPELVEAANLEAGRASYP